MKKGLLIFICSFCLHQTAKASHPAPNFIVINEIKTFGSAGAHDEFVELFNVSDSLFDISGYQLIYFFASGQPYKVVATFPDSTFIKPYRYFLLASADYSDNKQPDGTLTECLLSNGQLLLTDSTKTDTLDAVAWGQISALITNEGKSASYHVPVIGPSVSPDLQGEPRYSLQRNPEGTDTNENFSDFKIRYVPTPMNSSDSLKMIICNSLQAVPKENNTVEISWKTITRLKDQQFDILEKIGNQTEWQLVESVSAAPEITRLDTSCYVLNHEIKNACVEYAFRIRELDFTKHARYSEIVTIRPLQQRDRVLPKAYSIAQNYPNPFNPATVIPYKLHADGKITIQILNIYGQLVKVLFDGSKSAGSYELSWDATDTAGRHVASGEYILVFDYNNISISAKKIIVLR
ncbi:lamin tail domain-containing protein [candidate division KSB1 bacterium]|nr:lamin tail domain-containing protein [candidate division KSB1 bacterium]